MSKQKTSKARVYAMRLNPINERERKVMEIIEGWIERDYDFKKLAMDRILRGEGFTPEMFEHDQRGQFAYFLSQMESMFSRFAEEIISELQHGGARMSAENQDAGQDGETSQFAQNFARSFIQRQKRGLGDDE